MKYSVSSRLAIVFFVFIPIVACQSVASYSREHIVEKFVPSISDRMNIFFSVAVFPFEQFPRLGKSFDLKLANLSEDTIRFNENDFLRLYKVDYATNQFTKVDDLTVYGFFDVYLTPPGSGLSTNYVSVSPDIKDDGVAVDLLVVVCGYVVNNGKLSEIPVCSYLIATLNSK